LLLIVLLIVDLVFFFSSRRRHTRWPRDWSSDVCSSDLGPVDWRGDPEHRTAGRARFDRASHIRPERHAAAGWAAGRPLRAEPPQDRKSRRVGKECRSRWSPYHLRKKECIDISRRVDVYR